MKRSPVYHLHRFDPLWGFVTETRIAEADRAFEIPAAAGLPESRQC
jgi:hypothetical protein